MAVVEIADVDELQAVNADLSADYMLVNDIDASATTGWNDGDGFEPIGFPASNNFTGRFYGRDYEITGLYINRPTENRQSLIRYNAGFVADLHVLGADVQGQGIIGVLVGSNAGTIACCTTSGSVTAVEVPDSSVPSFGRQAGGLVGAAIGSIIRESSSSADITVDHRRAGGFVGFLQSGDINDCYSTGSVSLTTNNTFGYIGGFVGHVGTYGTARRSYSTANVSATEGSNQNYVGGFCGGRDGSISNSFWDKETSGQDEDGYNGTATGKTTSQMQDISTYNDTTTTGLNSVWDIATDANWVDEIWSINDGNDYPKLKRPSSQVPDVIGSTETSAATTLDNNNLLVGDEIREWKQDIPESEVFDQDPLGGTWVVAGFGVDLWISLGSTGVYVNMNGEAVMCQVYVRDAGEAVLGKVNVK